MMNSCVMHRQTAPPPGITAWGGIGYQSRTHLVCIACTLNSRRYISEVLEPIAFFNFRAIFQQDNAQSHVTLIVQRFFVYHRIELLPLPARSPDLSPIEYMWSMVVH
ncbi:transposable element Tcb1 transposase [Trichonephila clavipes]|nr:transposable element Tcb1 transposase [Trichonephila clavipes]